MDFAASTSGFEACLSHLISLESNAVILYKFWRPQPTLPWLALQYSISTNTRTMVSLSSMQGGFANSWLRKQTWRNQKEGRVGCLHQNILTREVIDLPPTFAIIIHIPRSCIWRPACPPHTSLRPILDVPKSLVSPPQVPTQASQSPRPLVAVPVFLYTALRALLLNLLETKGRLFKRGLT